MADDLKPVPLNGAPQPAAPAKAPETPAPADVLSSSPAATAPQVEDDLTDIERWIREHPEDESEPAATPQAQDTTPAAALTTTAPASTAQPQAEAKPADPQAQQQAAPAKPAFDPAEKFALGDGIEWSREQLLNGLQERYVWGQEAQAFRSTFGMTAEQAAQAWGPVINRLRNEPNTTAFLDGYLSNAEKAKYLEQCARYFDEENGVAAAAQPQAQAQQPQPAQLDPQTRATINELAQWRQQKANEEAQQRLNRELQDFYTQYPALKDDRDVLRQVMRTAAVLHQQNPNLGFPEAVKELSGMLNAVQAQRAQAQPQPAQTAGATTPAPAPALLASSGASPTSTKPAPRAPAKDVDPVDDWLANAPALGFA